MTSLKIAALVACFATLKRGTAYADASVVVLVAPPSADLTATLEHTFRQRAWNIRIEQQQVFRLPPLASLKDEAPRLRVYVDLHNAGWARLVYVHPGGERFLIRDLPLRNGLDEVAIESLSLVVHSGVDSLLSGGDFELNRHDAEATLRATPATPSPLPWAQAHSFPSPQPQAGAPGEPQPPPGAPRAGPTQAPPPIPTLRGEAEPRSPVASARWRKFIGTGYTVSPQGDAAMPWMSGPHLMAGRSSSSSQMQVELTWLTPTLVRGEELGGTLGGGSFRAGWGPRRERGSFAITLLPRVGLDVMRVHPEATAMTTAASQSPAHTFVSPMLGMGVGGSARYGALLVMAVVSAEYDVLGTRFSAQRGEQRQTIAELWRVRPSVSLTVGWAGR